MDEKMPPTLANPAQPPLPADPLPDETVRRITAEETFRYGMQKKLGKENEEAPESKSVKFLNSPFGLFLLGAIFVSGLGGIFQWWQQQLKKDDARRTVQKKILSEYRWRLNDLDKLVSDAATKSDLESKGADSILIYRIAYGAAEYRTSQPEFQNSSWGGLITQLEEFGISDSGSQAIKATNILMSGPYLGQDSLKRGYFAPGVLEDQQKTLQNYYENERKRIYDTSVWRVFHQT
jgi:hypothetical protein